MKNNLWDAALFSLAERRTSFRKRRYEFLRETRNTPDGKLLIERYRTVQDVLCLLSLAFLVALIAIFGVLNLLHIHTALMQKIVAVSFDWLVFSFVFPAFIMSDCEYIFVRTVVRRRARIAARSYPRTAEKLLWFFLPPETCEECIDALNSKFEARKAKFGTSWARWWYRWQVARSLSPSFDLLIERLIKWGVLGWIGRHI